jgi:hypothetical protein
LKGAAELLQSVQVAGKVPENRISVPAQTHSFHHVEEYVSTEVIRQKNRRIRSVKGGQKSVKRRSTAGEPGERTLRTPDRVESTPGLPARDGGIESETPSQGRKVSGGNR